MKSFPIIVMIATLVCGCARLPALGEPTVMANRVRERDSGPIVVMFGGYLTSAKDLNLGALESALLVCERMQGSVAVFSWRALRKAKAWCEAEADKRAASGEVAEFAIAGHSWGGHSSCKLARWVLDDMGVDTRVRALVTLDAVRQGYCRSACAIWMTCTAFGCISNQRHGFMALREAPVPDGTKLQHHINYYQRDTACFNGGHMWTATENHLEWRDAGYEADHGNFDGLLAETVAEDIRRSFDPKWSTP